MSTNRKLHTAFPLAFLCFTFAYSKGQGHGQGQGQGHGQGQGQGHGQGQVKVKANIVMATNRKSHVGFRLADLNMTLAHSKG